MTHHLRSLGEVSPRATLFSLSLNENQRKTPLIDILLLLFCQTVLTSSPQLYFHAKFLNDTHKGEKSGSACMLMTLFVSSQAQRANGIVLHFCFTLLYSVAQLSCSPLAGTAEPKGLYT